MTAQKLNELFKKCQKVFGKSPTASEIITFLLYESSNGALGGASPSAEMICAQISVARLTADDAVKIIGAVSRRAPVLVNVYHDHAIPLLNNRIMRFITSRN